MITFRRLPALAAALSVATTCMLAAPALPLATAQAPSAPADQNSKGYLGFCDASGHQVRSGLLNAAPFAWKTVSSVPAPQGYGRGKASITAFQPRQNVDPYDWNGKLMTAASTFSNADHPMAEATVIDPAFADFTGTYPAELDGLVQVRMGFTGLNLPQYAGPYPSVYIRVDGDRWTQLGGGTVDCTAGQARSAEKVTLPASRFEVKRTRPAPESAAEIRRRTTDSRSTGDASSTGSSTSGGSGTSARGTSANGVGDSSASPVSGGGDGTRTEAADAADDSGSGLGWVWLPVAAAAALGVAFLVVRRRRASE